ncbi:MAG: hypothetical protein HOJ15_02155 [Candidatus Jacksonbacteria bacterium]|jgi:hypothetical protein|nr:hypothetical protein [Candidatus Jacksonbacteria bacterium]MBT6034770.1 hypothetical protein [Candidatus Jacksonbacteria bacterium]MBT6301208.1 hypothetical protein [Candidatus Jacksonbacteria bacterium]MBT6757042.1 hypothetical protein [Candidatus Jacksonbacteria bacterium]MBT6954811.1 hypothetical protein [Candidatus Jacksonbacteria bacterium]
MKLLVLGPENHHPAIAGLNGDHQIETMLDRLLREDVDRRTGSGTFGNLNRAAAGKRAVVIDLSDLCNTGTRIRAMAARHIQESTDTWPDVIVIPSAKNSGIVKIGRRDTFNPENSAKATTREELQGILDWMENRRAGQELQVIDAALQHPRHEASTHD